MHHLPGKLLIAAVQLQLKLLERFHINSLLIRKAQPVFCTDRISAAVFQPHKSQMIYLAIILRFLHIGNNRRIDLCIRISGIFPLFYPVDLDISTIILLNLQVILDIFLRGSTVKGQQDIRRFSFVSIHRNFCLGTTAISRCRSLSGRTLAYILYILHIFLRRRCFLCLRTGCISAHCGFFLALLCFFLRFCLCFTGVFRHGFFLRGFFLLCAFFHDRCLRRTSAVSFCLHFYPADGFQHDSFLRGCFQHGFFLPCAFQGRCTRRCLDRCSGRGLDRCSGRGFNRCSGRGLNRRSGRGLDRCSGRGLCGSLPISFRRGFRHGSFLLYCFLRGS